MIKLIGALFDLPWYGFVPIWVIFAIGALGAVCGILWIIIWPFETIRRLHRKMNWLVDGAGQNNDEWDEMVVNIKAIKEKLEENKT